MAVLEEASAKAEEPIVEEVNNDERENVRFVDALKSIFRSKYFKYAGSAAAGVAVSLVSTMVAGSLRK